MLSNFKVNEFAFINIPLAKDFAKKFGIFLTLFFKSIQIKDYNN